MSSDPTPPTEGLTVDKVKRYRLSPVRGVVEDDGGIYPIGVSDPMVLASVYDDVDRERMLAQGWGESVLAKLTEVYGQRNDALKERDQWIEKAAANMTLYLDLLMQVVHVVPGETRHESARRILKQHEERRSEGPCSAKADTTPAPPLPGCNRLGEGEE